MACNETITTHVNGHLHAFLQDNVVMDIHTFDETSHTTSIVEDVKSAFGHDDVVCLCNYGSIPVKYSTWDGVQFTHPTTKWLFDNGHSNFDPDAPKPIAEETPTVAAETTVPTA